MHLRDFLSRQNNLTTWEAFKECEPFRRLPSDSTCGSESTREVCKVSEDSAVENIEVFVLKRFGNCVLCFCVCVVFGGLIAVFVIG